MARVAASAEGTAASFAFIIVFWPTGGEGHNPVVGGSGGSSCASGSAGAPSGRGNVCLRGSSATTFGRQRKVLGVQHCDLSTQVVHASGVADDIVGHGEAVGARRLGVE